jgi:ATP-dependent DNA helicase RecG
MSAFDRSITAAELFDRLVNLDESEHIEAKRGSEIGTSVMETVCAFANEPGLGGGCILLGVVREEFALFPSYEVCGVDQPDKLSSDLASRCRGDFNVPVRIDIRPDKLDGKTVLMAFVPEASASDKPIYFKNQSLPRGAYRRIGPTDQRCTEDDLQVFFDGRSNETYDYSAIVDTSIEDIDPDALADYRRARAEASPDAEELRWSDADLLQALGCTRSSQGKVALTVAGVLLFGKPMVLRRLFPMMRVDYIRVPGRDWIPDPDKRFDSIEMRDPLFRLIRRATAAVLDDLPKSFSLPEGQLQRQDIYRIPQRVIREAIVNAVMHRNYRVQGPIQIIRYSNRIEIINPGFSLKSPEHLGEPGSQTRNPRIAAVLHETRFAETKGSGIRVMRDMMERAGLTPPAFESDRTQDKFTGRYLFHHFLGPEDLAWLSRFKELALSDEEARALIWVREVGAIDNATFRELARVDALTASQKLRRLRTADLLQQKGKGSATYYIPTALLVGSGGGVDEEDTAPDISALHPDLQGLPPDPSPLAPNLDQMLMRAELPPAIQRQLGELGQRTRDRDRLRNVLLAICGLRFYRVDELAHLTARNPEYLQKNYLSPMVAEGRLVHRYPKDPNHPQQAYGVPELAAGDAER